MGNIIIPHRSSRTPRWPMRLNANHPLTEGLLAFVPLIRPGVFRDLVSRKAPDSGTYPTERSFLSHTVKGYGGDRVGCVFDGSTHYMIFNLPSTVAYPCTLAAGMFSVGTFPTTTAMTAAALQFGGGGTDASGLGVGTSATGTRPRCITWTTSGTGSEAINPSTSNLQGSIRATRITGRFLGNNNRILQEDCLAANPDTISRARTLPGSFVIGTHVTGPTPDQFYTEALEYAALWSIDLGEARSVEFNLNPWQIVKRNPLRIYSFPTGWTFDEALHPNGVSLTHLSGAYTDIDEDPSTPDGSWLTMS